MDYDALLHKAKGYERYLWLDKYLSRDSDFLAKHVYPIRQGAPNRKNTEVIIADFTRNANQTPKLTLFPEHGSISANELEDRLQDRPEEIHGRIIFVCALSGVHSSIRERKLRYNPSLETRPTQNARKEVPVLTWPRTAGEPGTHPIQGHESTLPDPEVLNHVREHAHIDPESLLRFLDQSAHLIYQTRARQKLSLASSTSTFPIRKEVRIGIDQANHLTAVIDQEQVNGPWTVTILATEDNCLGIDFNETASWLQQPLRESPACPTSDFQLKLSTLTDNERKCILKDPSSVVSLYSSYLASAFAAHIELYRRSWAISYEPYANTSVVYGYAYHRDAVRQLARRYNTHLRYIGHTLDGLRRWLPSDPSNTTPAYFPAFEALIADFEYFGREITAMKTNCDQFLEQQVSKLALQDARTSLREARDLKRLSYLAFIFVPLSLTSSFFGMNVRELDSGSTPVWVFVLTAVAILLSSLFIVQVSGSKWVEAVGKKISSIFKGTKIEQFPPKPPITGSKPPVFVAVEPPENPYITAFTLTPAIPGPWNPAKPESSQTFWNFWRRNKRKEQTYVLPGYGAPPPPTPQTNDPPAMFSAFTSFPLSQEMYEDANEVTYGGQNEMSAPADPVWYPQYADPMPVVARDMYENANRRMLNDGIEEGIGGSYTAYRPVGDGYDYGGTLSGDR